MDLVSAYSEDAVQALTETERKRREAVWELFQSECVFLIDHLMVLKNVRFLPFVTRPVEGVGGEGIRGKVVSYPGFRDVWGTPSLKT